MSNDFIIIIPLRFWENGFIEKYNHLIDIYELLKLFLIKLKARYYILLFVFRWEFKYAGHQSKYEKHPGNVRRQIT